MRSPAQWRNEGMVDRPRRQSGGAAKWGDNGKNEGDEGAWHQAFHKIAGRPGRQ